MVKSKKMSKTGIAVIVLAILLVLSMVMGMTGAWYTKTAAGDGAQSGTISLRDRWLTLTLTVDDGAIEAYRSDKTTQVDLDKVMPGDYIKADSSTFTVSAALAGNDEDVTSVTAWVFLLNAAGRYVQSGSITTGTPVVFDAIEIDVESETLETDKVALGAKDGQGYYLVNQNLTEASMGQNIASFSIGDYSVVAIQSENIADVAAAAAALNIQAAA